MSRREVDAIGRSATRHTEVCAPTSSPDCARAAVLNCGRASGLRAAVKDQDSRLHVLAFQDQIIAAEESVANR